MKYARSKRWTYKVTTAVALAMVAGACASSSDSQPRTKAFDSASEQTDHSEMLLRYCKKLRGKDDLHVAASICRRAFDLNPTEPEPLYELAEIYGELGALNNKASVYKMALQINPDDLEALYGLAKTSIDLGNFEMAVAQLEHGLRLDSRDLRIYNAMGIAKDQLGEHETAQALYRAGLSIDPHNVSLRNNLGLSLSLSGDHAESVAMLRDVAREPGAGAVGGRNLALAATNASNTMTNLASSVDDSQPMEILIPADEKDQEKADGPPAAEKKAPNPAMAAAKPKPMTDDGGSIGSATGNVADGKKGAGNDAAARMPAGAFAKKPEGDSAVPSPDKISKSLKKQKTASLPPGTISYTVQVGAFGTEKAAERGWRIFSERAKTLLGKRPHNVIRADLGGETGVVYRVRTGSLDARSEADSLCNGLKKQKVGCFVVRLPEAKTTPLGSKTTAKPKPTAKAASKVEKAEMPASKGSMKKPAKKARKDGETKG